MLITPGATSRTRPLNCRRARPRHSSTVRVRAAAGLAVVVIVGTGGLADTGAVAASSTRPAEVSAGTAAAAVTAARSLADETPGAAIIPAGLSTELGYTPSLVHGLAANPGGDCSSPVPLPEEFEPACRVHDLGYDLLRVAHRAGTTIPRGLRADLDDLLGDQMRESCGDHTPCRAMARVARTAVAVNTARQGHGAPVEERLPW